MRLLRTEIVRKCLFPFLETFTGPKPLAYSQIALPKIVDTTEDMSDGPDNGRVCNTVTRDSGSKLAADTPTHSNVVDSCSSNIGNLLYIGNNNSGDKKKTKQKTKKSSNC